MTDQERIKELEEALDVVQRGLRTAAEINCDQTKELNTLRPIVDAVRTLWRFCFNGTPIVGD